MAVNSWYPVKTIWNSRLFASGLLVFAFFLLAGCGIKKGRNDIRQNERIADADGNAYTSVVIGSQVWMAQNLQTTRFRNGDPIPLVPIDNEWENSAQGAWCFYNNERKFGKSYGNLYNWHAVSDSRGICPPGWHVPSDEEWQVLSDFLGGDKVAGDKMKETGTRHWAEPNNGATNISGFTALPAGGRDEFGQFIVDRYGCHWWSSTVTGSVDVRVRSIYFGYGSIMTDEYHPNSGFSVRCLKD